jgi:XTP/dITP diphosphohydrolase
MAFPLPLVLATQNTDKAREIVEILVTHADDAFVAYAIEGIAFLVDSTDHIGAAVTGLPELSAVPDVDETGATLEDNARIKACAVSEAFGLVAFADDTGLEVDALGGAPGVHSARYAGPNASYSDNVVKLLREMHDVAPERRTARFATVAMARWPDGRELAVRGEVEGTITTTFRGANGFGYDPVFAPAEGDGRTFAEMTADEKHAVSHRGRAFRALVAALDERE